VFVVLGNTLSSEDELELVEADGEGDGRTWRVSTRVQRVVGRVSKSVGLPESCKHRLVLLVRSGVRVEGCRDRLGSLGIKNLVCVKKKVEGCLVWAAYTKESRRDRVKLSLLHRSGNVSYYKQWNKVITIPLLHRSGNEGMGKISKSIYKMVRGSHKRRIRHTKGGEGHIKRTVGLSGHIGCSCAPSVILLIVACGYRHRRATWMGGVDMGGRGCVVAVTG
jgi:hypothetical protein